MEWYYAQDGQQKGPVSEAELAGLVNSGLVTDTTLVWHGGLTNWQPYGQVKASAAPPPESPPIVQAPLRADQAVCAECGGIFSTDQVLELGGVRVCAACKPLRIQKMKEGVAGVPFAPTQSRYAGFWIRVGAKMIDGLILGLVVFVPIGLFFLSSIAKANPKSPDEFPTGMLAIQAVVQVISMLAIVAYNTFFIGKYGATLGKMAVGIKVIMADGSAPTMMRAFGRAWAEQLSGLVCYIGYIIVAFDEEKRGLHDHICTTRVVFK